MGIAESDIRQLVKTGGIGYGKDEGGVAFTVNFARPVVAQNGDLVGEITFTPEHILLGGIVLDWIPVRGTTSYFVDYYANLLKGFNIELA